MSIMFFVHVHYIDGVAFSHSHPFQDKDHTHSQEEFLWIHAAGDFRSAELKPGYTELVGYGAGFSNLPAYVVPCFTGQSLFCFSLRAPPSAL
ncbi:MAG: hypothetical protein LUE93_04530 [Bacteroides sp.]|nr:hypothetical protein [Bacteroides sp.]